MAVNGVGGVSEPNNVQLDSSLNDENPIVSVIANGVTEKFNSDENELQSFDGEELTGEEKIISDKMDICQQQIDNLLKQLENLRADMRSATMQLATGGDAASTMQTMRSINQSINSVYDSINKVYLQMMSYETELEASTLDYIKTGTTNTGGGKTVDSSSYKLRDNATKEGKSVVDKGLSYDDKSANQMKNIMQSKGYRYDENAWCADFVTFVLGETYGKNNVPGDFINTCSNTAGCGSIKRWSQGNGSWTNDVNSLQPGDLVIFDWDGDGGTDHVGIFISKNSDGTINTVEGNTTGSAGSSCVETKVRAPKCINGYVRLSGLS